MFAVIFQRIFLTKKIETNRNIVTLNDRKSCRANENSYAKCYDVKNDVKKELEHSAICTPFSVKALSLVCNLKSIIICNSIHSDSTRCVAVKVSSVVQYKLSWMENQSQKPNTFYENVVSCSRRNQFGSAETFSHRARLYARKYL